MVRKYQLEVRVRPEMFVFMKWRTIVAFKGPEAVYKLVQLGGWRNLSVEHDVLEGILARTNFKVSLVCISLGLT